MPHQRYDRLRFTRVIRTKPKNVVTGDGQRRSRATLANHENVMGIRVGFDHGNLRARLRSDDDLNAALVQILDSFESL